MAIVFLAVLVDVFKVADEILENIADNIFVGNVLLECNVTVIVENDPENK